MLAAWSIVLLVALSAIVGMASFNMDRIDRASERDYPWKWESSFHVPMVLAVILSAMAAARVALLAGRLPRVGGTPEEACRENYKRCMVGLGAALLAFAILTIVALSGFAYSGTLPRIFGFAKSAPGTLGPTTGSKIDQMVLLLVSLIMSLLGALFYVTNSLREKRKATEEFDWTIFWSGLWYRLGEAVLFTIVFFLAIRRFSDPGTDAWLPLLALFLGMCVTAGERLVFGLARRVFGAVEAFLPLEKADVSGAFDSLMPDEPTALKAVRVDAKSIEVNWDRPKGGPSVRGYKVVARVGSAGQWQKAATTTADQLKTTLIGLPATEDVAVRVIAHNDAGESDPTQPAVVIAQSKPEPRLEVTAVNKKKDGDE